jgi:hypothetical protein
VNITPALAAPLATPEPPSQPVPSLIPPTGPRVPEVSRLGGGKLGGSAVEGGLQGARDGVTPRPRGHLMDGLLAQIRAKQEHGCSGRGSAFVPPVPRKGEGPERPGLMAQIRARQSRAEAGDGDDVELAPKPASDRGDAMGGLLAQIRARTQSSE